MRPTATHRLSLYLCVVLALLTIPRPLFATPPSATVNISGVWRTNWGPLTFRQNGLSLTGTWDQGHGAPGVITGGQVDPASRTVTFTYYQHWNEATGTTKLTLSQDESQLSGTWSQTYPSGGHDQGTWTMTRLWGGEWKDDSDDFGGSNAGGHQ